MIHVVMSTSPVKSNPDTSIIDATIKSIKERLPDSHITIMFDGVPEDKEDMRTNYNLFIDQVVEHLDSINRIHIFEDHSQQAIMLSKIIESINDKDLILYVEHDCPLTGEIPFEDLEALIRSGNIDVIRLHYATILPPYHFHMMLETEPFIQNNVPIVRTFQWSQRPHLTSKAFYLRILHDNFSPYEKTFIEERMHWVCARDYRVNGWNKYKLAIYCPEGNIQRSLHLDARKA